MPTESKFTCPRCGSRSYINKQCLACGEEEEEPIINPADIYRKLFSDDEEE
jgi:predicted nucleic-acid-binding Zn-ribbon protein